MSFPFANRLGGVSTEGWKIGSVSCEILDAVIESVEFFDPIKQAKATKPFITAVDGRNPANQLIW